MYEKENKDEIEWKKQIDAIEDLKGNYFDRL